MISKIIFTISPFLVFMPIIAALIKRSVLPSAWKFIAGYLIISAINGVIGFACWKAGINNLWLSHCFIYPEFILLVLAIVPKDQYRFYRIFWISLSFIFLAHLTFLGTNPDFFWKMNSWGKCAEAIALCFLSLRRLGTLTSAAEISLFVLPEFWVLSGILLYFMSSVFIFGGTNLILFKDKDANKLIWLIHIGMVAVHFILITIGILKLRNHESILDNSHGH